MPSKIRKAGGAKIRKYPVRPHKKPDFSKGPTPPASPKEFREEPLDTGQKYRLVRDVGSPKRAGAYDRELGPSVDIWRTSPSRKAAEETRRDRQNRMSPAQRVYRRKREQKEREREAADRAYLEKRLRAIETEQEESRQRKREAEQKAKGRRQAFREKMESKK
jgi:hypothetical protein